MAGAAALTALLEGSEATAWVVFIQDTTHPAPPTPVSSILPVGDYVSIRWRGPFWCQAEASGVQSAQVGTACTYLNCAQAGPAPLDGEMFVSVSLNRVLTDLRQKQRCTCLKQHLVGTVVTHKSG